MTNNYDSANSTCVNLITNARLCVRIKIRMLKNQKAMMDQWVMTELVNIQRKRRPNYAIKANVSDASSPVIWRWSVTFP